MDKNEKEIREMLSPNREKLDSMNCFSHSQYGRFCECEARAVAVLKKEWTEKTSAALTFGKYFHSYFEGPEAFAKFKNENIDEIFTKKGELRAEFKVADTMFKKITGDPKAAAFATGLHEVDIDGEINGVPWRGKIDVLDMENLWFTDLKAVADLYAGEWMVLKDEAGNWRNRKVSFIEAYHYHRQMAIYREILKQRTGKNFAPMMLAVSKQEYPAIELIGFTDFPRLEMEVAEIEISQDRFVDLKAGKAQPEWCGKCDYCRAMKRVSRMITPKDLERMVM